MPGSASSKRIEVAEGQSKSEMVNDQALAQIETKTKPAAIQVINVYPGLSFRFQWNSDEAVKIGEGGSTTFVSEVKRRVEQALPT